MKRYQFVIMVTIAAILAAIGASLADIAATTVSGTRFYRTTSSVIGGVYAPGEAIAFTNCVMFSDSIGTTQSLTGVTGTVKVVTQTGTNTTTNVTALTIGTNDTLAFAVTVPSNATGNPQFQVLLVDSNSVQAYYPPARLTLLEVL